jgi:hypothetical protein
VNAMTVCSKSGWEPQMRREHALVAMALRRSVDVLFIEAPSDIRSLDPARPTGYFRALGGTFGEKGVRGLRVIRRATPVPGHRNRLAEVADCALLRRTVARHADRTGPTVCNLPWQWPATAGAHRRVFDCADDWTRLFPQHRNRRITQLFARIAGEADEVIVASPDLVHLFSGRACSLVPNGADADGVAGHAAPRPERRSLVYVGTLSERFDEGLVSAVLRAMPQWTLELYGPCHYAGSGDRPDRELAALLHEFGGRTRWHGPIPRSRVADVIDAADVVVVPNRPELSRGQSSMKLYDAAGRGRPVVASPGVLCGEGERPPGTYVAEGPEEWVSAVEAAAVEEGTLAVDRIAWARSNTWEERWPAWAVGVFGNPLLTAVGG